MIQDRRKDNQPRPKLKQDWDDADLPDMRAGVAEIRKQLEATEHFGISMTSLRTADARHAVNYIAHLESAATPAAGQAGLASWQGAADWLRNNAYLYPNLATICDAMVAASPEAAPVAADTEQATDEHTRYRFLLSFLLDRGVLHRYENGVWRLRGIYGVDDSGLKGAGRTPEEALDNAIIATNLNPGAADKFWRQSCEKVLASQAPAVAALGKLCGQLERAKRFKHVATGTSQTHSYLEYEDVSCFVEEARRSLATPADAGAGQPSADDLAADATALADTLRNHHAVDDWCWDDLINAADMITKLIARLSTSGAPVTAKKCRYCDGDGEHYEGPSQYAECAACHGSGWVTRDAEIGTDQECFVCDGKGEVNDGQSPAPVTPSDYVLLPREITVEMAVAAWGRDVLEQAPGATYVDDETKGIYARLISAAPAPVTAEPAAWMSAEQKPEPYAVVMCRLSNGFQRVGRWSGSQWQYAEFLHHDTERNKYPPIEQKTLPVVEWCALLATPAPADRDAIRAADFRNVTAVERSSDQSVRLTFTSCRAASEFQRAADAVETRDAKGGEQ